MENEKNNCIYIYGFFVHCISVYFVYLSKSIDIIDTKNICHILK